MFVPTIAWLEFRTNESYAREYLRSFKPTDEHAHDPIGPQAAAKAGAVSVHSGEFLDEKGQPARAHARAG